MTGIRYEQDGRVTTVPGDQVILSAGAYHSPKILLLSGIGPVAELERHEIPVVCPLEGVGENFQDHTVSICRTRAPSRTGKSGSFPASC